MIQGPLHPGLHPEEHEAEAGEMGEAGHLRRAEETPGELCLQRLPSHLTPHTSHPSPLTSHYVLSVRFTASLDHLAEHWRPATDTYRLAQSTQEQGSLLRQEGSCASAGQGEGAPQPHDLWRHPPQLPGALLCPGGGGDGAHTKKRGKHVKVPSVHF